MHNLYALFAKFWDIYKQVSGNLVNESGNMSRRVVVSKFSELETANIGLEVSYRFNWKERKPRFSAFAKARKRIETLFSQLCDQFMIMKNYAKDTGTDCLPGLSED